MVRGRARRQRAGSRHRRLPADSRPHAGAGRQAGPGARPAHGRNRDRGCRLRRHAHPGARHVCRALGKDAGVPGDRERALAGPPCPAGARLEDAARQGPGARPGQAVARLAPGCARHRRRRDEQRSGCDRAPAGRGGPSQRRTGAAGARPKARRGELASDRAGASRAPAVRPQEAARRAGSATRGGAGAAAAGIRVDRGRGRASRADQRGYASGQDHRALASIHCEGRQEGGWAGRRRPRRVGGAQRRGRGGGDCAHPARGSRGAGPHRGAGDARPHIGASRRRQAGGVGLGRRGLCRPAICQDRCRRAARSHHRSRGQALRAGGADLPAEASALPAGHAGGGLGPRCACPRACRLPHALLRPGARWCGGGAGARAGRYAREQATASGRARLAARRLADGAQAGEGAWPSLPPVGGVVSVLGQNRPVDDRQGSCRGSRGAWPGRPRR